MPSGLLMKPLRTVGTKETRPCGETGMGWATDERTERTLAPSQVQISRNSVVAHSDAE